MQTHIALRGTEIPRLGFGTWQLRGEAGYRTIRCALEVGYRHVDTAASYDNEEIVGRAIADSGLDREAVFLATKIPMEALSSGAVGTSLRRSLRKLDTDYVDLALVHWPNPDVPISETMEALQLAQSQGMCHHFGVSNFTPTLLRTALEAARPLALQVEYHPFLDQSELLRLCRENEMMLTAYSPLARGQVFDDPTLRRIASAHGVSPAVVSLAYLLRDPEVGVIPKASGRHVEANLEALWVSLTPDEIAQIDALPKDRRIIDPDFAPDWEARPPRGVAGSVHTG
jgi:2,5-diketo-D-gluconate reductase B